LHPSPNKTVPNTTSSSSTSFVRRFLPIATKPNTPNGKIEAKKGRDPCISSADRGPVPLLLWAIVTVAVADTADVPDTCSEVGANVQLAPAGAAQVRLTA
jgi:hypothetical protein